MLHMRYFCKYFSPSVLAIDQSEEELIKNKTASSDLMINKNKIKRPKSDDKRISLSNVFILILESANE